MESGCVAVSLALAAPRGRLDPHMATFGNPALTLVTLPAASGIGDGSTDRMQTWPDLHGRCRQGMLRDAFGTRVEPDRFAVIAGL